MNWLALHALARPGDGLIEPLRAMMQRQADIEADPKIADFSKMRKRAETAGVNQEKPSARGALPASARPQGLPPSSGRRAR
jgi:hypothetical protein